MLRMEERDEEKLKLKAWLPVLALDFHAFKSSVTIFLSSNLPTFLYIEGEGGGERRECEGLERKEIKS